MFKQLKGLVSEGYSIVMGELDGLRMQSLVPSSLGVCEWGFAVRKAYEVVSLPGTRRRERDQGWKMKSWISKKY